MVGVIAADAQETYTGKFETSAINCRINLDLGEIAKEEKGYKPLPDYYNFGDKKEEILRQNFIRISQEIQAMVQKFKPAPTNTPPKASMKQNGK